MKFSTEIVKLPSKGVLYPKSNPLSSGEIEMRYVTAADEDLLTTPSWINKGLEALTDKLLSEIIVDKSIDLDSMLIGDRNAVLVAAYIASWGKMYRFKMYNPTKKVEDIARVDLTTLEHTVIKYPPIVEDKNEFSYTTPYALDELTYKLLTWGDYKSIREENQVREKINPAKSNFITLELIQSIKSVNGNTDFGKIAEYSTSMFRMDRVAFTEFIDDNRPDVIFVGKVEMDGYTQGGVTLPFSALDLFLNPPTK